jgi:hypothetical protein
MDGRSTTKKSTITVDNLGVVPAVNGNGMIPIGWTYSLPNPTRGETKGFDFVPLDSHLLKGWPIQDISQTSVVDQDTIDCVVGNC